MLFIIWLPFICIKSQYLPQKFFHQTPSIYIFRSEWQSKFQSHIISIYLYCGLNIKFTRNAMNGTNVLALWRGKITPERTQTFTLRYEKINYTNHLLRKPNTWEEITAGLLRILKFVQPKLMQVEATGIYERPA